MDVRLGSPDREGKVLAAAFNLAVTSADSAGYRHLWLAIPTLGDLLGGGFDGLLGEPNVRKLKRDQALGLGPMMLYLSTRRVAIRHRGPVLAAWTTRNHTARLLRSPLVSHLFYVPRTDADVEQFLRQVHNPARF